ncbi:carboxypeptidase regulatory-like domain-containing protein [bacterium]|nr:carboxypeptidase regulatory-like domain-containing protein [bacterium]
MIPSRLNRLLAATLCLAATAASANAQAVAPRLENSLTAGGLNIAPRYLDRPGDVDLNLLGGFVNFPTTGGSLLGGQVGLQARLSDRLQLLANLGPLNEIGLRGPLWTGEATRLGWAAHYRSDLYFAIAPSFGLPAPMFGLVPFPGSVGQGAELKLNAMHAWNGLSLYASPLVAVMSNRSMAGLDVGVDWTLDRWGLGYAAEYRRNVHNPRQAHGSLVDSELQHSVGMRFSLDERKYLQANYYHLPTDTYGITNQTFLVGMGMRLLGEVRRPTLAVAPTPAPTPVPLATLAPATPAPEPDPTPTPSPTPAPRAVEAEVWRLEGRLFSSKLPGGNPGKALPVHLKRKEGRTFVNLELSTLTDASGNFVFDGLRGGEYQVVYRDRGELADSVGVAVSNAVAVRRNRPARVEMDLAWDEAALQDTRSNGAHVIAWSRKPGAPDAHFQGVVRSNPNDSRTDVVAFPKAPTTGTTGQFAASPQIEGRKLYYFVKYWKRGSSFNGATYYGQSKVRVLGAPQPGR